MSDPQPAPGRHTPPRAEPQQPDDLARGNTTGSAPAVDIDNAAATSAEGQNDGGSKERPTAEESQTENALKNVTEGYK